MKDVDRTKLYNSHKQVAGEQVPDPSPEDKELLILEARLEMATGEDRLRIEELIRETIQLKEAKEAKQRQGPEASP
jgi:hypothetical protein